MAGVEGRVASEGKGPQRPPQKRLGRRLEEVGKAVAGGYCRLPMPLKGAFAVRGTVAGHRLSALEGGGGGSPHFQCIPGVGCAARCSVAFRVTFPLHPPPPPSGLFQKGGEGAVLDTEVCVPEITGRHFFFGLTQRVQSRVLKPILGKRFLVAKSIFPLKNFCWTRGQGSEELALSPLKQEPFPPWSRFPKTVLSQSNPPPPHPPTDLELVPEQCSLMPTTLPCHKTACQALSSLPLLCLQLPPGTG